MSNLSEVYQKKTDKQHILDNPDTYIGSVENVEGCHWIFDPSQNKIVNADMEFLPGLYKLFDEGIVNCRDHVIRMDQKVHDEPTANHHPVTNVEIDIREDGTISMYNDGNGIDVAKHPEYDLWIPEMIFGHLRTSTNYNKTEEKIVGGKNGFGFKLVLIWSSIGSIETIDHVRKLKYTQTFEDNLNVIHPPTITKSSAKPYTRITFRPDYKRFEIDGLTEYMRKLFAKRVYDISAVTRRTLKVHLNGEMLSTKTFAQYVDLYLGASTPKVHDDSTPRWEYVVGLSPSDEFNQVSFVNGIYTSKGGKHVDYIIQQITKKMIAYIEKKKKVVVNAINIKEQLFLFLRCDVVNPAFDSQTKDFMNTPISKFGSSCVVSDKFIEKLAKMGVMDAACAIHEVKENKAAKKNDGNKTRSIRGIPKLIDANWAGTAKSTDCTIIFCEGDSAKAGIVSGLSSDDRNTIGVYPMKGKLFNVRGEPIKKISENKEISEIKKILGLETGKSYNVENIRKSLRYGRILFMTDQDLDGSHIKGLGINMFQSLWTDLSKIHGFMGFMNTPILKAKKGSMELLFYNDGEYNHWKEHTDIKGWKIKYYKGLGTSTGKEFKEYFENKKVVLFEHTDDECADAIDKVFNKKRADDRKDWLGKYDRQLYLDTNNASVSYSDFIDREMIHFSKYDCDRSIPNLMDGLKISLRKILYSAFKKNLTHEIKVAQFSGYVSEHSGYHHGEASLNGAIVGLAQNYVGSNNINLFQPNGQFGTRLQGGKDSASERYIFTQLSSLTRHLFPQDDDAILTYLDDDGSPVEPVYYAPIIPMVLVNGSKGIGTGFSTEILPYYPPQIIHYIKQKLVGSDVSGLRFTPYFEGFTGSILQLSDTKFLVCGKYQVIGIDKIRVSELPIGFWTDDFKEHLETLTLNVDKNGKRVSPLVKEIDDMSRSTNVDVIITFTPGILQQLEGKTIDNGCNNLEKTLKLFTTFSTTNMHMFDANEKLKKYTTIPEIIDEYYITRLELYQKRKDYILQILEKQLKICSNKRKYIQEMLDETIDLRKKSKTAIIEILQLKHYDVIDDDCDYKYLLKMPLDSVSDENVSKLTLEFQDKQDKFTELETTNIHDMWLAELELLETEYDKFISAHRIGVANEANSKPSKKKK